MSKLNIRPTTGVYSTYKRLNYKIYSAIAEFVDNSTQSYFDNREELRLTKYFKLRIEIFYEYTSNGDKLTIKDNAYGMNFKDFQRALILDKPPQNKHGRNEFGMGLKTAASWFGNRWSVRTSELNNDKEYFAEIDVDILEKYKNEEIDVSEVVVNKKEHYTIITIERLNQKLANEKTNTINSKIRKQIVNQLSSTYRQDLRTDEIEILFNDVPLQFEEPEIYEEPLANSGKKVWKDDVNFSIEDGERTLFVKGFIAIRIPGSTTDAGFTLLRNGRVIIGGSDANYRPNEVFGRSNSYTYQRLFGELHLDDWDVTQAKDSFRWENNGLQEKFIEKLVEITHEYRKFAEKYREKKTIHIQELKEIAMKRMEKAGIFKNVQSVDSGKSISSTQNVTEQTPTINDDKEFITIDSGNEIIRTIQLNSKIVVKIITNLIVNSPGIDWLSINKQDSDTYRINVNILHEFFKPFSTKPEFISFITLFSSAIALAEIECGFISDDGRIDPAELRNIINQYFEKLIDKGVEESKNVDSN
jgi:hypothetical protein